MVVSQSSSKRHPAVWHEANRSYLIDCLSQLRRQLEHKAERAIATPQPQSSWPLPLLALQTHAQVSQYVLHRAIAQGSALKKLCQRLRLTPFEVNVLLLCAGVELEATWGPLCAAAQADPQRPYPTFGLALALFPQAHWSALTPDASLRRWQLIRLNPEQPLTSSPLRIDERILHYLLGLSYLDEVLANRVQPVTLKTELVPSHRAIADQVTQLWQGQLPSAGYPAIQLCGPDRAGKQAIAAATCQQLGWRLYSLSTFLLPSQSQDLQRFIQRWQRESLLTRSALLIDDDGTTPEGNHAQATLTHALESITGPVFVSSRDRRSPSHRVVITFEIGSPTAQEQRHLWQTSLGNTANQLNGYIDALVSQFDLTAPTVAAIGHSVGQSAAATNSQDRQGAAAAGDRLKQQLWAACRSQARPKMEDLAQPIVSRAHWDDLVLPAEQKLVLKEIAAHVRQRATVYDRWGFGGDTGRGLGISALFAGASGTGKTMAAEVLALELQLDLYRIDLSAVVSKYIGETEKNLRRVFDAAEMGGAILLFDEADALFGKRSEVKDSHDRHANIEVSYLLQRMEAYRGLAILTTNLKDALDQAFLRRLRFTVRFPFPDAVQRAEIWRRVFPKTVPTEGLKPEKLARLNVAGGNIRNIALNAAFLAADAGEAVQMHHLLEASRSEYIKLEKPLIDAEIKGWVKRDQGARV
ncbi:MAG: ATP-binding protein [Cyanobacteria bacterium P01_F01_bin.56]